MVNVIWWKKWQGQGEKNRPSWSTSETKNARPKQNKEGKKREAGQKPSHTRAEMWNALILSPWFSEISSISSPFCCWNPKNQNYPAVHGRNPELTEMVYPILVPFFLHFVSYLPRVSNQDLACPSTVSLLEFLCFCRFFYFNSQNLKVFATFNEFYPPLSFSSHVWWHERIYPIIIP